MTKDTDGKKRLLCEIHSICTIKTMGLILLRVCHIVLPQRRLHPFSIVNVNGTNKFKGVSDAKYSTVYQLCVEFLEVKSSNNGSKLYARN